MTQSIKIGNASIGGGPEAPLLVIAGPCVLEEDESLSLEVGRRMMDICDRLGLPYVFKSSFDKANRTSVTNYRGPGMLRGLRMLSDIRSKLGVPVITDLHTVEQVGPVAEALDAIQIPAFLCRQTDLILAAAATGKPVNIKKGQFLSPSDVKNIIGKATTTGNQNIILTERGVSFGYNNLVVDMRGFPIMRGLGYPVVFDVTHSLQLPGGMGSSTGGQRQFAPHLMRAAVAAGVDGLFIEVHPDPECAPCDGPNMIYLKDVEAMLADAVAIHKIVNKASG